MAKPIRRRIPLHVRLAVLYSMAALVLVAVALSLAGRHAAALARDQMLALLQRSAHLAAVRVDLVLAEVQLEGQRVLHSVPPGDAAGLRSALAGLVRQDSRLSGALLYGPDGQALLSVAAAASTGGTLPDIPHPGQTVGPLRPAPDNGSPVIAVPIHPTPGPRDARRLVLLLRQAGLLHELAASSMGQDDPALQLVDLRAVPGAGPTGPLDVRAICNCPAASVTPAPVVTHPLLAARRAHSAPWAVLARMPEASIKHSSASMARKLAPWAVIGILLAAVTGIATALWVTFPLRRLTTSAEHLAQGSLSESTGIQRGDEVGQLAATFDAMSEELRRRWEENSELYRRELRRVHMLQALEEVAQAANSTLSLDQVLETILRRSTQLIGVFVCAITLVDEDGRAHAHSSAGLSDGFLAEMGGGPDEFARRAIDERRVITAYNPTIDSEHPELWQQEEIVAVGCAPMVHGDRAIGCIGVYSKEQSYFTDEQLHVLTALAAQAAVAVRNAHLYAESQRKTSEVRSSFRRIGAALASGLRLDDTLALIAELACEMLHADACIIRLLDAAGAELVVRATHGLGADELSGVRLKAGEGLAGLVARSGAPLSVPDILDDPRSLGVPPESDIRAYLGVPLRVQTRVTGVLAIFKRTAYRFTPEEIELLSSFGAQASIALENRRLYEQESRTAHTLQRSLLPVIPRDLEGMELGEIYSPSQAQLDVGGDFYDLFPLDHGRVGVVMGDVCGKGLRAAVYTAMAKYAIRSYAYDNPTPSEVMRRTNRALCRQITDEHLFVSIVYALLDGPSMTLALASAGHPPPIHYRQATQAAVTLEAEGTLAGLLPTSRYTDLYVPLQRDDVLFFYTDGIVEARQGKELWGIDALTRVVERYAQASAPELVQAVVAEGTRFAGGDIADDVALLAIKMR